MPAPGRSKYHSYCEHLRAYLGGGGGSRRKGPSSAAMAQGTLWRHHYLVCSAFAGIALEDILG